MAPAALTLDILKLGQKPKVSLARTAPKDDAKVSQIGVTASAAVAIRTELAKRPTTTPKSGFRLSVQSGGCSGLSYVFGYEDAPREDDRIAQKDGVFVYCDPKSHVYLAGTELDYIRTLMKTGFEVKNPRAKSGCGCGESFTI